MLDAMAAGRMFETALEIVAALTQAHSSINA
jgi:hypothetical protein